MTENLSLTSTHEDYIEAVFRRAAGEPLGVRITDLAGDLGCRLPTVTRTVRRLSDQGYFAHKTRGRVRLTSKGTALAREVAHRHDDTVAFLEEVLGLPREVAEDDACRLEHGLSRMAAERLHGLLEYLAGLSPRERGKMLRAVRVRGAEPSFRNLVAVRTQGWRG